MSVGMMLMVGGVVIFLAAICTTVLIGVKNRKDRKKLDEYLRDNY